MKRWFSATLALSLCTGTFAAETPAPKTAPYQFCVVPDKGIYPADWNITGLRINLSRVVNKDVSGLDIGLFNHSDNEAGLQLSLGTSDCRDIYGLQFTLLHCDTLDAYGVQFSGLTVESEDIRGLQLTPFLAWAQNVRGFQIAGLASEAQLSSIDTNTCSDTYGLQLAGLSCKADHLNGAQLALWQSEADNVRGLQTGGLFAEAADTTGIQLSAIYTKCADLHGIQAGPAVARAQGNAKNAVQLSGIFAEANSTTNSLQAAGLIALSSNASTRSIQIGGLGCESEQGSGLQLGGTFVRSDDYRGAQLTCGAALSGDLQGLQVGPLLAQARGNASNSLQASLLVSECVNAERSMQLGGLVSRTRGKADRAIQLAGINSEATAINGLQLAGGWNVVTDELSGTQASLLFNRASKVKGAQIGLINYCTRLQGLQLGLINIQATPEKRHVWPLLQVAF